MIFRILEDQFAQKSRDAKAADARFMQLALTLGRRGQGRTWPNPAVGAVIVKDGVIVGRGWTQPGGRPHAEPDALKRAGEAARGATLYVTLEPCSHFGKSPPCVDAVIASGIARVVSAIEDPNPEVAGQGHAKLRAAGIVVDVRPGAAEAVRDHAGHFRRIRDKRPHVILKLAVSADDKIGAAGAQVIRVAATTKPPRLDLPAVLHALSDKGISRLMVEGGARVASSFVTAGLVDEVWLLRAPDMVGADGIPALDALPLSALTGSPALKVRASESVGNDTLMIYERV
jgi:pyrimidine deaminase RibD-like protein